jgi:predicted methyltransferase
MKSIMLLLLLIGYCTTPSYAKDLTFTETGRPSADIKRDAASKGPSIVQLANIKPGMTVVDLLGGGGYYSEILSGAVGSEGKVYLHNNKAYLPYVDKELKARLANNRLANVEDYQRETDNLEFQPNSVDAIFYILGYHDIYHVVDGWKIDRDNFLDQITKAIKKGGKLVIVDHSATLGSGIKDAQDLHRIDVDYVRNEVKSLGFSLEIESNLLQNSDDDRSLTPFKPEIRRKTDRFVLVFTKL